MSQPKQTDMQKKMAALRALRGKGGAKRKNSVRKELKDAKKLLMQQGKQLAKQGKLLERLTGKGKKVKSPVSRRKK